MAMEIISVDGTFVLKNDAEQWIKSVRDGLITGSRYNTLAIIGAQSKGKSTVLNMMFGTTFNTRTLSQTIAQTTKGIHMQIKENLVILDVEGIDNQNKGEMGVVLENKKAAFALAVSDILIINLMANDIGTEHASCARLLRTVLKAQIEMNRDHINHRKTLLFLIRDFSEKRFKLSTLEQILRGMVYEITEKIRIDLNDLVTESNELIELKFLATTIDFEWRDQEAGMLANKFTNPSDNGFLFTNSNLNMPIERLVEHYEQIWKNISDNEYRIIPLSVNLLSNFYCKQYMEFSIIEMKIKLKLLMEKENCQEAKNFERLAKDYTLESIKQYEEYAQNYIRSYYETYACELRHQLEFEFDCAIVKWKSRSETMCNECKYAELSELNSLLKILEEQDEQFGVKNFTIVARSYAKEAKAKYHRSAHNYFNSIYQRHKIHLDHIIEETYKMVLIKRIERSETKCNIIKEIVLNNLKHKLDLLEEQDKEHILRDYLTTARSYSDASIEDYRNSTENYDRNTAERIEFELKLKVEDVWYSTLTSRKTRHESIIADLKRRALDRLEEALRDNINIEDTKDSEATIKSYVGRTLQHLSYTLNELLNVDIPSHKSQLEQLASETCQKYIQNFIFYNRFKMIAPTAIGVGSMVFSFGFSTPAVAAAVVAPEVGYITAAINIAKTVGTRAIASIITIV